MNDPSRSPVAPGMDVPERDARERSNRLSGLILVGANLVPLFGALFFGWSVFDIVFLYWVENLVVGLINILRIFSVPNRSRASGVDGILGLGAKLSIAIFFTIHYGIFCLVHGAFVFTLLGEGRGVSVFAGPGIPIAPASGILALVGDLGWAILALAAGHLISFFMNFRGQREFENRTLQQQMMAPYPRMIALHIAIVLGAFAVQTLGQPLILLVILVVGKTIVDWRLHLRSHRSRS